MRCRSIFTTLALVSVVGLTACDSESPAVQYELSRLDGAPPLDPAPPPVIEGSFSLGVDAVNGDESFLFPPAGRSAELYMVVLDVLNPGGSLVQIRDISEGGSGRVVFHATPGPGDLNGTYAINTTTNTVHLDLTYRDRHFVGDAAITNLLKVNRTGYINITLTSASADPCAADRVAPAINMVVNRDRIWPANHQMILVASGISATDNSGSASLSVTVSSNESVNGNGDGNTSSDWSVVPNGDGTFDVFVRAERSGNGNGRTYSITAIATDHCSNTSSATAAVLVPKSQKP